MLKHVCSKHNELYQKPAGQEVVQTRVEETGKQLYIEVLYVMCPWYGCCEKYDTSTMLLLHVIDDHFNPEKNKNIEQTCMFPCKWGPGICGITYRTDNKESGQAIRRHIISHIGLHVCKHEFKEYQQLCGEKFISRDALEVHKKKHRGERKKYEPKIKIKESVPKIRKVPDNDCGTTGRLVRYGDTWFLDTIGLWETQGPNLHYICLKKTSRKKVCGASFTRLQEFQNHSLYHAEIQDAWLLLGIA
jgi:hypothetical protein